MSGITTNSRNEFLRKSSHARANNRAATGLFCRGALTELKMEDSQKLMDDSAKIGFRVAVGFRKSAAQIQKEPNAPRPDSQIAGQR
jgi:hypothetical protein